MNRAGEFAGLNSVFATALLKALDPRVLFVHVYSTVFGLLNNFVHFCDIFSRVALQAAIITLPIAWEAFLFGMQSVIAETLLSFFPGCYPPCYNLVTNRIVILLLPRNVISLQRNCKHFRHIGNNWWSRNDIHQTDTVLE